MYKEFILGEKLRTVYKQIGMSQDKLEVNANLAFGIISRVEGI